MGDLRERLQTIMDAPGYGKGRAFRDQKAQENEALALLPEPRLVAPVLASQSPGDGWPLCNMGEGANGAWFVITDSVRASEMVSIELPSDAESDAHTVAAIINAYRMGLLVRREAAQ